MDELTDKFDDVKIRGNANFGEYAARQTEPKDHRLFLDFPALDLLPDNVKLPHLDPPVDAAQRESPPNSPSHLGVFDTSFFVIMPLRPRSVQPARYADKVQDLLSAIDSLPNNPGKSTLKMVAYHDPYSQRLIYKFCLQKVVQRMKQNYDFELDEESCYRLMLHLNDVKWLRLLHHLVLRESDRAYYHVKERLEAKYGAQMTQSESENWPEPWYSRPPRRPKELLVLRLELDIVPYSNEIKLGAMLVFKLPCGHKWAISRSDLVSMTPTDCHRMVCDDCGARVWNDDDKHENLLRLKNYARMIYEPEAAFWRLLDDDVSTIQHQTFDADLIYKALIKALPSLTPPPLVCPPELSPSPYGSSPHTTIPSRSPHVRTIGDAIGEFFSVETYVAPANDVYYACRAIAQMAITGNIGANVNPEQLPLGFKERIERGKICDSVEDLPPGFLQFVVKWIKRAVNYVYDEQHQGWVGMWEKELDFAESEKTRLEEDGKVVDAMLKREIESAHWEMMGMMMQKTSIS